MYFSSSTGGFYDEALHGSRTIEHVTADPDTGETLDRWTEPNPQCLIPDDAVEITSEQHAALIEGQSKGKHIVADANGHPVLQDPPAPTAEQIVATIAAAVQAHMDATAKTAGYDNIASAVTYADEPAVARFQTEGRAFRAWRSLVWAACYQLVGEVNAGTREPMSADQVIAELPAFALPA